jgi:hypothetical protein
LLADPPVVRITAPAHGATVGTGQVIALRGDVVSGTYSSLTWRVNGAPVGSGNRADISIATAGDAVITLTASGAPGLEGSASVTVHVVADTSGPTVRILAPTDLSVHPEPQVQFTAQATGLGGVVLSDVTFVWTSDLDGYLGTGATIMAPLSYTPGFHVITVTGTNPRGLSGTDAVRVIPYVIP